MPNNEYIFLTEWDIAAPRAVVYEILKEGREYPRWWPDARSSLARPHLASSEILPHNGRMKKKVISVSRSVMGGTPVFTGTRVPVETLFDYIEGHETIDAFLKDFPTVSKTQVFELIEQIKAEALHPAKAA